MKSRHLAMATVLALATGPSAGSERRVAPAAPFPGFAYAGVLSGSHSEYARIFFGSNTVDVGRLQTYFFSGGFANNDFTHEYAVGYPSADLYSIDTSDASTTLIGNIGLKNEGTVRGPRWDPISGESFLMAPDASCGASTLYTIDLSTAATTLVGTSSGTCIVAIAIDPMGIMYGVDLVAGEVVSISKLDGSTQEVMPLGFDVAQVIGMDFNPADGSLYLIAEDLATRSEGIYVVGGAGVVLLGPTDVYGPFAFAVDSDRVFFNGFEVP